MPTIRQAMEKISELRSRTAVIEMLMLYLDANYVDDDSGEAEMSVTRDDAAIVPQEHIKEFQAWLAEQVDQADSEIEEWESMQLLEPEEKPVTPKVSTRKGKKAARARTDSSS